jgi:hypothetical protein
MRTESRSEPGKRKREGGLLGDAVVETLSGAAPRSALSSSTTPLLQSIPQNVQRSWERQLVADLLNIGNEQSGKKTSSWFVHRILLPCIADLSSSSTHQSSDLDARSAALPTYEEIYTAVCRRLLPHASANQSGSDSDCDRNEKGNQQQPTDSVIPVKVQHSAKRRIRDFVNEQKRSKVDQDRP